MTKGQLVGNTHSEKSCEDVSGLYSVSELLSSTELDVGVVYFQYIYLCKRSNTIGML